MDVDEVMSKIDNIRYKQDDFLDKKVHPYLGIIPPDQKEKNPKMDYMIKNCMCVPDPEYVYQKEMKDYILLSNEFGKQ